MTDLIRLNANTVVSSHPNCSVIIWDIAKRTPVHIFESYHKQKIHSLLRVTDDVFISYDKLSIKWCDMTQGSKKCVKTFSEDNATVLQMSSDGTLFVGVKHLLKFYDPINNKWINVDTQYSKSPITAVKEWKKGKFIIGYQDGYLQVFDSKTKTFNPITLGKDLQDSLTLTVLKQNS